jgi:hypothetical protein
MRRLPPRLLADSLAPRYVFLLFRCWAVESRAALNSYLYLIDSWTWNFYLDMELLLTATAVLPELLDVDDAVVAPR